MTNFIRFPLLAAVLIVTAGCGAITDPDLKGWDFCKANGMTVASVSVTPTSLVLKQGTSAQVSATVNDPNSAIAMDCASPARWTTSDTLVASVYGSADKATIKALDIGQTVIILSAGDKQATIQVTVTNPAAAVGGDAK